METLTYAQICMYLEVYTNRQLSHDDVECGKFAEACILALTQKSVNAPALIAELSALKGKTAPEIGLERCNALFAQVRQLISNPAPANGSYAQMYSAQPPVQPQTAANPAAPAQPNGSYAQMYGNQPQTAAKPASGKSMVLVLIAIGAVLLIGLGVLTMYFMKYQKNKNFQNGIAGSYSCTKAYAYLVGEGKHTFSEFKGLNLTIKEDGKVITDASSGATQLEYTGNMFSTLVQYKPTDESGIIRYVQYFKEGSKDTSPDADQAYYDVDTLKVGLGQSGQTFFMTFEKTD